MKTIAQAVNTTINALNAQLETLKTASEQELKNIFEQAIQEAFTSVDPSDHKKLYKTLSLKMHPDKLDHAYDESEEFMKELKSRNFVSLPIQALGDTWRKVEAANDLNEPEASTTYNPFSYVEAINKKAIESLVKIHLLQQTEPLSDPYEIIDRVLKEQFPELYKYEQYSSIMKNVMYWTAAGVNSTIAVSFIALAIASIIPKLTKSLFELPLLNYATEGRYGQRPAQILVMRTLLTQSNCDTSNLSDIEIEDAFNNILQTTDESQRAFLRSREVVIETLTDEAITLLFKKIWIASTIDVLSTNAPELSRNDAVVRALRMLRTTNIMDNEAVLHAFANTSDDTVNEIYAALRKVQNDNIVKSIEQARVGTLFTGLVHLNMVFTALQETWMADVPVMKRIMQALVLIVTLPLTAAGFLWDEFCQLFMATMILFKAASVGLMNAPLDIYEYFTATKATTPVAATDDVSGDEVPTNDYASATSRLAGNGVFSPRSGRPAVVDVPEVISEWALSID